MMEQYLPRQDAQDLAHLVDVLASKSGAEPAGYRLGGYLSGPSIVALGHDPVAGAVFERLLSVPTLAWMRGRLSLVFSDRICSRGWTEIVQDGHVNQTILLPISGSPKRLSTNIDAGYWAVLRTCAYLGMIEGRGIQIRPRQFGGN